MKSLKYMMAAGCLLTLGLSSCSDFLDVNVDPDKPNNTTAEVANRVPWIQRMFMYSAGITNYRTSMIAGVLYSTSGTHGPAAVTWNFAPGTTTSSYQTWFVETAANLNDLYNKAKAENAYHYMAVADIYHALGFMQMLDLYGEIPYTEALGNSPVPAYDDGKTIFNGCVAKLDEAIKLLSEAQPATATPLSKGDLMNGGDAQKWLKMAYGLKARFLLKLSKKAEFDPEAILDCLSKGPQSIDDNSVMPCFNSGQDVTDYLMGDPIMTNGNWNCVAYGTTQRITKYYTDLLTDMRGAGVEDPRYTKIVPAVMTNIKVVDGKVQSYDWARSKGVDCHGDCERLKAVGWNSIVAPTWAATNKDITYNIADATARDKFVSDIQKLHKTTVDGTKVKVTYQTGSVYVNSTNYAYAGDTAYVSLRSNSKLTGNQTKEENDVYWYFSTNDALNAGAVGSTGSFQTRPVSDFEIMTYHEACFIKAEVLYRKGDKSGALTAYKAGIKAHLDYMQKKLTEWQGQGYNNPDMMPMNNDAITAYMNSAAVCQNASDLKMSDIMLQKYVAMGCSLENWNDMRRFNYGAGNIADFGVVYPGMDRSVLFTGTDKLKGTSKDDPKYWPRRWRLPATLELSYNEAQALAINKHAEDTDIWSYPVWWDCATDAEYEGYLK
ncbi:MAG: SusD/RagB family nutrient-binding outer membrane lipoprotein [Prevotella sp.]|nr:SusD/RagB family nutrient-binding outer membrane lipoprotein [Prevotella sp.]MDD7189218.1 SusD/RagB family nutrient-binding outer membrane lipoprotein [Prevotella sp.]MDY5313490.1 SusD/RagB family nutrient-binding outer membrane lipoprotein [Prevotella sp.]